MKIREITKRIGVAALSVLCAFCCFLTPVTTIALAATVEAVTSEAVDGAFTYPGLIRGTDTITEFQALCHFSDISETPRYELLRDYDCYSSQYGVKFVQKYGANTYYFWRNNDLGHWKAFSNDGHSWGCTCGECKGTQTSDTGSAGTITGADLKEIAADYNSRYAPMSNPEQFIWSYNSDNSVNKTKKDRNGRYDFTPYCPVYMYTSGAWGGQKWTDFYLIAFMVDDTVGSYYGQYYVHCYSKNSDGVVTFYTDYYSLSDGTLFQSRSATWDVSTYPYMAVCYPAGSAMFCFRIYKSSSDYLSNNATTSKTLLTSNVAMPLLSTADSTKTDYTKFYSWTTFTPDTNKSDDYGFLCSSKPFELFANQTQIDWQKIPDNYVITINGDTIYNYPVTDPSTGNSTIMSQFIINNYIISGGSTDIDEPIDPPYIREDPNVILSGNVKVNGNINISADPIQIKTDPIDINVNVNQAGGSGSGSPAGTSEHVDISGYLDTLPEQSKTLTDYLKIFFDFLPPQLLAVLLGGIGAAVLCRVLGR